MTTRKSRSRNRNTTASRDPAGDATKAIGDSAQRIWLAGLGAYERARAEGPRVFDTLVEQGKSLGGQARAAADDALRALRDTAGSAGGRFDKLEQAFEDRISRSLRRLGVITRAEVSDLNQGVRELSDQVREMMAQQGTSGRRSSARGGSRRTQGATRKAKRAAGNARRTVKRAAGNAERTVKRAAGNAERTVKRTASKARRSVAQRTRKRGRRGARA